MIKCENGIFEIEGELHACLSDLTISVLSIAETLGTKAENINRLEAINFVIKACVLGIMDFMDKDVLEGRVDDKKFHESINTISDIVSMMCISEVGELTDFGNIHKIKDNLNTVAEAVIMNK